MNIYISINPNPDGVLSSTFLALTDSIGGSINNTASNGSNIINRTRHIKRIIPYTLSSAHPSS
jgi:mannose/fructose-specific phosphotransferase system component IIA